MNAVHRVANVTLGSRTITDAAEHEEHNFAIVVDWSISRLLKLYFVSFEFIDYSSK